MKTIDAYYNQLVGQTIRRVVKDPSDDRASWQGDTYGLELDTGDVVWVLADPEGNGPGFLDIQNIRGGGSL